MGKYDSENINWKGHKEDFLNIKFSELSRGERTKFLRTKSLQYRDVPVCKKCNHVYFNCICYDKEAQERLKSRKAEMKKPFEDKLKHSMDLVEEVLKTVKSNILLAYSAGIDSECCLQLFKKAVIDGRVKVIFGDTLVNYPDSYNRVEEVEEELGIKVLRVQPKQGVSFQQIIKKHGLPLYSRGSTSDLKEARATLTCCGLLKKKPMREATKKADGLILGLKMSENQYRRFSILRYGDFYKTKGSGYRILPIAYWTLEDEWKFQKLLGFKYNKLYDKTLPDVPNYKPRTGCWCCPQPAYSIGHLLWLKRYYLSYFNVLMNKYGMKEHVVIKIVGGRSYLVKKLKNSKENYKPCSE